MQEVTSVMCHRSTEDSALDSYLAVIGHEMRTVSLLWSHFRPIEARVLLVESPERAQIGDLSLRPFVGREPKPLFQGSVVKLRSRHTMLAHLVLKVAEQHPSLSKLRT